MKRVPVCNMGPVIHPEDIRFELQRVDAQIRLELELIGQRMNWMSISHSFLFSAFTLETVSDSSAGRSSFTHLGDGSAVPGCRAALPSAPA